jgi:hypothetical protein
VDSNKFIILKIVPMKNSTEDFIDFNLRDNCLGNNLNERNTQVDDFYDVSSDDTSSTDEK